MRSVLIAALLASTVSPAIAQTQAPDDVYDELRKHFSEDESVKITTAIGAINVWNRLAVAFRAPHPVDAPKAAA